MKFVNSIGEQTKKSILFIVLYACSFIKLSVISFVLTLPIFMLLNVYMPEILCGKSPSEILVLNFPMSGTAERLNDPKNCLLPQMDRSKEESTVLESSVSPKK